MNILKDRKDLFCKRDLEDIFTEEEIKHIMRRCRYHISFSITKKSKIIGGFKTYKHYSLEHLIHNIKEYDRPTRGKRAYLDITEKYNKAVLSKMSVFREYLLNRGS